MVPYKVCVRERKNERERLKVIIKLMIAILITLITLIALVLLPVAPSRDGPFQHPSSDAHSR